MTSQDSNQSILDDILARITVQSADGSIRIDSSSLGKKTPETKSVQQALSEEGLYVSKGHRFYNDGYPGGITDFGLLVKANPMQALKHIDNAITDNNLSEKDILKLQIALNASTDNPKTKIAVDGLMGPQTANRLADHLAQQDIKPDPNSALGKALQKYADPAKIEALGIDSKNGTSRRFNDVSDQTHTHDHEQETLPAKPAGSQELDANSKALTLQAPIDNMRVTSTLKQRTSKSHQGIDINTDKFGDANYGLPIYAPAKGIVAYSGESNGYGNLISLYHGDGVYTQYGHVPRTDHLSRGQTIDAKENFAQIGNAGGVNTHLHFEVIIERNGVGYIIDPKKALAPGTDLSDPKVQDNLIEHANKILTKNTSASFEGRVASFNEDHYETTLAATNIPGDKPTIG